MTTAVLMVSLVGAPIAVARAEVPDELRGAVQRGDTAETRRLLARVPTGQRDAAATAALIWSAYYGRTETLNALLKDGLPATTADPRGWTALMAAVKGDASAAVDILLSHGADPDMPQKNGGPSAATLAAELGRADLLARLRQHRPMSTRAATALFSVGVDNSRLDLIRAALTDPALQVVGATGQDALLTAIALKDVAMVNTLLDRGANASDTPSPPNPPPLIGAIMSGDDAILRVLLDRGADVNRVYDRGIMPLRAAIALKAEKAAAGFLARGATPGRAKDLVALAVEKGMPSLVQPLLAAGAEIDHADDEGRTPLMLAVASHHEAVDALLAGHPRLDLRDHGGKSVFDLPDGAWFAEKLRGAGTGTEKSATAASSRLEPAQLAQALLAAVKRNDAPAVKTLLDQGAKPQTCDKLGWPVSVLAACKGYTEVLRCLFERDAFVLSQSGPDSFWDPFMEAAANGHLDTVRFLLAHPNAADPSPEKINSVMDYVEERGHSEMARLLRDQLEKAAPDALTGSRVTRSTAP